MSTESQPLFCMMSVTDLCVSRTEDAGRAWEDPGGPVTGRDWSTGCSAEEGTLEVYRNTLHGVKSCCRHTLTDTSHAGLLLGFSHGNSTEHINDDSLWRF